MTASLQIGGTDIPVINPEVATLHLDEGMHQLDAITLAFAPGVGAWTDAVTLGATYELTLDDTSSHVFTGLIVSLSHDLSAGSHAIVARGVDSFFKLKQQRKTKVWDTLTPEDIVSQIASDHGLSADYTGPSLTASTEFQDNISDAAFLQRLATRFHCFIRVRDKKLQFGRAQVGAEPITATAWSNLDRFDVSYGLDGLLTKVSVHGWDGESDAAVEGESTGSSLGQISSSDTGPSALKDAVGGGSELLLDNTGLALAGHAKAHAEAVQQAAAERYVTARAVLIGEPTAVSGRILEVEGLGDQSGTYLIRASSHDLNQHVGYVCTVDLVSDSAPKGE